MCGIFGLFRHASRAVPAEALLRATARRLRQRGPDGQGIYADAGIGLVHTRLSLVDLDERSAQPFWDATGRYGLVYNGELYDYAGLRDELAEKGAAFRTTSDTEVLLEALLRFGIEPALRRLQGMFAFALYDRQDDTLVLARDRFGIKPLYVYDGGDAFVFGSTVTAMKPWLALRPDALTAAAYLHGFQGPMSGRSFYEDVTIVPPGAIVRVGRGVRARFSQCLTMNDLFDPGLAAQYARRPAADLVDEVDALLGQSVAGQLCADVPVGALCSGGVDSSVVMAMAARSHGDLRVFHAEIAGPLSERSAAERLSRHLGLDLKVVEVRDEHFVATLPDVVAHFGAPFVNPTTVPILLVSRLVHEHGIKAVLTGEGSDECFLGYDWLLPDAGRAIRHLPRDLLRRLSWRRRRRNHSSARDQALVTHLASRFEDELGPAEFPGAPDVRYQAPGCAGLGRDGHLSHTLRTLLHRNDSLGMAASVESRFPFLDSRLVSASAHLPYDCKVRFSPLAWHGRHPFLIDKWIVRQVAARYLPPDLSRRPKRAFPTDAFQRFQITDGFFDDGFVAEWFGLARPRLRHLLGHASPALRRRLMIFDAWADICLRELPRATLAARLARHVTVRPLGYQDTRSPATALDAVAVEEAP